MKKRIRTSSYPVTKPSFRAVLVVSAMSVLAQAVHAASGTWENATSGDTWSDTGAWLSSTVADGADSTADFSALDISGAVSVTFDASHTLGYLVFGDTNTSTAGTWTLADTLNSGLALTLQTTVAGTTPAITVGSGTTATIQTVVAGNQGFVKNGAGTLIFSTNADTWTGNAFVNAGTLTLNIGQATTSGAAANFVLANGTTLSGNQALSVNNSIYASSGTAAISLNASASMNALFYGNGNLTWNEPGMNNVATGNTALVSVFGNYGGTIQWGTSSSGIRLTSSSSGTGSINPFANFDLGSASGGLSSKYGSTTVVLGGLQSTSSTTSIGGGAAGGSDGRNLIYVIGSANIDQTYAGGITNFAGVSAGTQLIKVGTGTWTLTGNDAAANVFLSTSNLTGGYSNQINGGTLLLDDSARTTAILAAASANSVGGGTLRIKGSSSSSVATTETMASMTALAGGGRIIVDPNGSSSTTVNLGALTANVAGSSLSIQTLGANAIVTTSTAPGSTGIYGGRIIYTDSNGNTDWATGTLSGSTYTISGYSGYSTFGGAGADASTTNYLLAGSNTMTAADSVNSLKVTTTAAGQSLDLGTFGLTVASSGVLFTGANDYSITDGTLTNSNAVPALVVFQSGTGNLTIGATIADGTAASSFTKAGTGTLTLTGTNTYTGITYVNNGILSISSNANLGAAATGATLALNGGTLQATSTFTLDNGGVNLRAVTLGGAGGTFDVTSGNSLTVDGVISNSLGNQFGPLIKTGSGTLVLSGVNTYGGATIIRGGILSTNSLAAGGTTSGIGASTSAGSALVLDGGILQIANASSSVTTNRTLTVTANGGGIDASNASGITTSFTSFLPIVASGTGNRTFTLTGSNTGANSFAGAVVDPSSGSTSLTKSGVGEWVMTGISNLYTGVTNVLAGTLALSGGSTNSIATSSSISVASGAILDVTGLTNSGIVLSSGQTLGGSGTVNGAVYTSSGSILSPGISGTNSGIGTLSVSSLTLSTGVVNNFEFGSSTNDLINVNTSGGLVINGGTFDLYAAGTTGKYTGTGTFNLFQYTGSIGGTGVSALTNASILNPVSGYTYAFSTSGGFVKLTITGSALVNSNWTATGGGSWATIGNWSAGVPNQAQTTANFLTSITANSTVTLDGSKTIGDLEITDASKSYTIAQGTGGSLILDNGSNAVVVNDNAGTHTISAPVTLSSNTTVTVTNSSDTLTMSGAVSNTSSAKTLTKSGAGTLVLSGNNTYGPAAGSVGTILNSGTLQVGSAAALGAGDVSVTNNSTLQSGAAGLTVANNFVETTGKTLTVDSQANTLTLSGVISESAASAALTKIGSGTLILTGASTYTGNTTISAGTLQLGSGGTTGTVTGNIVDNGTLSVNRSDDTTLANLISGTGGFNQIGTDNLTLSAANTFTGTTVISSGILTLGNALGLGGSTLNYNNQGGVLSFGTLTAATLGGLSGSEGIALANTSATAVALTAGANNASTSYSGILSGAGSFIKSGVGTLTLTGAQTYTGTTGVSAGTLLLQGSIGSSVTPAGAVTVSGGASLSISGGSVTAPSMSEPGAGASIILSNNGSITLSGGLSLNSGTSEASTTGSVQVLSGTLTANSVAVGRTGDNFGLTIQTSTPVNDDLYVNGGTVNIATTLGIGTASGSNSSSIVHEDSGLITVAGTTTITANNTRYSVLDVNGGTFTSNDTAGAGIQVGGNFAGGSGELLIRGTGVVNATTITMGDSTGVQGTSTTTSNAIELLGGTFNIGSGGIVVATPSSATTVTNIVNVGGTTYATAPTITASADWSTAVAMTLTNSSSGLAPTFRASDGSNVAHNITLNGVLSGTGGLTKTGAGSLTLNAANTFTGTLTITNGKVILGNSSALGSGSNVNMNGGTLAIPSSAQIVEGSAGSPGIGTLTLSANSIIDYGAGNTNTNYLTFANSSAITWTNGTTLSIYNWNVNADPTLSTTQLFFGTDNTGLSNSQLSQILFYSDNGSTFLGTGTFTNLGLGELTYLAVPEPATGALLLGSTALMFLARRRRKVC